MAESSNEGNFLNDVYTSAKELIADRFSSPFIFSYIVAWLLINYRAVITTFTNTSDKLPINEKIIEIQNYIHNASYSVPCIDELVLNSFEWAFLAAIFYTFIYPFIDFEITKFTLERKKAMHNARVIAEGGMVFSYKQVEKMRLSYVTTENELRRINEGSNVLIEQLRAQIQANDAVRNERHDASPPEELKESPIEPIEVDTKLELAEAYIEMGDLHGAKELLNEIIKEGGPNQLKSAKAGLKMIDRILNPKINTPKVKEKTLTRNQEKILIFIGEMADKEIEDVTESQIKAELGLSTTIIKDAIGVLKNSKFIKSDYHNNDFYFQLDSLGLDYYVKKTSN